jgi:hypothetical protein
MTIPITKKKRPAQNKRRDLIISNDSQSTLQRFSPQISCRNTTVPIGILAGMPASVKTCGTSAEDIPSGADLRPMADWDTSAGEGKASAMPESGVRLSRQLRSVQSVLHYMRKIWNYPHSNPAGHREPDEAT